MQKVALNVVCIYDARYPFFVIQTPIPVVRYMHERSDMIML
jgi:hypothetical protein